jgi:hypothetical protein
MRGQGWFMGIAANEITLLKQNSPWCFTCERGVKMGGELNNEEKTWSNTVRALRIGLDQNRNPIRGLGAIVRFAQNTISTIHIYTTKRWRIKDVLKLSIVPAYGHCFLAPVPLHMGELTRDLDSRSTVNLM